MLLCIILPILTAKLIVTGYRLGDQLCWIYLISRGATEWGELPEIVEYLDWLSYLGGGGVDWMT